MYINVGQFLVFTRIVVYGSKVFSNIKDHQEVCYESMESFQKLKLVGFKVNSNILDQQFLVQWVQFLQKSLVPNLGQGQFLLILGDGSKVDFFCILMFPKCSHHILMVFQKTPKVFPNKFPRATIRNVNIRVKTHYVPLSRDLHV